MILPSKQVGKSQRCAARLPVQPDTEIVPGGLGRQPSLKALEEESEVTVHWGSALFMHLRAGTETMGDIIATTNLILETLAAGTYTVEVISRAARPFILVFSGLEMPEDPPEPPPTVEDLLTVDVPRAAGSEDAQVRPGSQVSLTATFSRPVSGFAIDDLVVGNGAAGNFASSGAVYTFDVTPNAIGEVTVDIAAGVAEDAEGKGNAAGYLSLGITYDDDGDGAISRNEAIAAVGDYFADRLTRDHTIGVIALYFAS